MFEDLKVDKHKLREIFAQANRRAGISDNDVNELRNRLSKSDP